MSLFVNNNYFKKTNTDMWKLSVALVKKHYDSVHLITDDAGAKYLESIPFDSVHRELNFVPKFDAVWSVGKIYAYKYICSLGEPFLHLDGDVFLWEPLPEDLLQSNIFCESEDIFKVGKDSYNYNLIPDTYPIPKIWSSNKGINTYSMGIIGGIDLLNIEKYCNFAIDMINNPKYYDLWYFPILTVQYHLIPKYKVLHSN
jgi:hypothetical protein